MTTKPTMQFSNPNTSVLLDVLEIPGNAANGMVLISGYMPKALALDIARQAVIWGGGTKAPEDRRGVSYSCVSKKWSFRHVGRTPQFFDTFAEAIAARDTFREREFIYDSGKRANPFQVTIRGKYVGQYPTLTEAQHARDEVLMFG